MDHGAPYPSSDNACATCRRMTSTLEGLKELASSVGFRHLCVDELVDSSESCPLCSLIKQWLDWIVELYGVDYEREWESIIYIFTETTQDIEQAEQLNSDYDYRRQPHSEYPFSYGELKELFCVVVSPEVDLSDLFIKKRKLVQDPQASGLKVFTATCDPAALILKTDATVISVRQPRITEKVKNMLIECELRHSNCIKTSDSILPARVIDVGSSTDSFVRLHISQNLEEGQYSALSYCWGGPQQYVMTNSNIEAMKAGIPLDALPLTIQDAVLVTRDLGLHYLWIDALCIIQDNENDKMHEIEQMGKIYKRSTVTIAAANTTCAQDSFLFDRPFQSLCHLTFNLPNGTLGSIWIKFLYPHIPLRVRPKMLETRAWALQEYILSPRILWYDVADLHWVCDTEVVNQIIRYHDHYTPEHLMSQHQLRLSRISKGSINTLVGPGESQLAKKITCQDFWVQLIKDYSTRCVSFPADRLPALAGIASELSILSEDKYIAGIWKTNLIQYLDWYPRNLSRTLPRTQSQISDLQLPPGVSAPCLHPIGSYRSPGWSWVSYEHPVYISGPRDNHNIPLDEYALVLSCEIELETPDVPFGRVKSGKLVLSTACVGESERRQMFLGENLYHRFDYESKYCRQDECAHLDPSLQYAYLGSRKGGWASALILAPAGDGTFMRIGLLHLRKRSLWRPEWMDRKIITII